MQREHLRRAINAATGIQSARWRRRRDKKDGRGNIIAAKGDWITMSFISNWKGGATRNFDPAGGHCFNAPTAQAAQRIKERAGVIVVLKMGEVDAHGEPRAVPRCLPVDVVEWTAEGETHRIED